MIRLEGPTRRGRRDGGGIRRATLQLLAGIAATCAVAACAGAAGPGTGNHRATAHFAPYADVSVASSSLPRLARDSGAGELALGFVVAGSHGCQAVWGGGLGISDPNVLRVARTVPAIVSFGGRDGPDLAQRCGTPSALAAQYERVVAAVNARGADFDVESAALRDSRSIERRSQALAALQAWAQRSNRPLSITLTLPADPSGLPAVSLAVVRSAVAAHVRVDRVNLLAMDFGGNDPARTPGRMAPYAIASAVHASGQLQRVLPDAAGSRVWPDVGITAMIGRNDVPSELFTAKDATELLDFATAHRVGWLSFWSLARDRTCPHGVDGSVEQESCSGVSEPPLGFSRLFSRYQG